MTTEEIANEIEGTTIDRFVELTKLDADGNRTVIARLDSGEVLVIKGKFDLKLVDEDTPIV